MSLLLDMNVPPAWAQALDAAGHVAMHWRQVGDPRASDATILAHARQHAWVVVTHDLDFGDILAATGGSAPSVVQLRTEGLRFAEVGPALLQALRVHEAALIDGALLSLDPRRMRVRLLPLAHKLG